MAILTQTDYFKGSVLELIGKEKKWVSENYPPQAKIENGQFERFIWFEILYDEDNKDKFAAFINARIQDGQIYAVGIRAKDYLFEVTEKDGPYLVGVEKPSAMDKSYIMWIRKSEDGRFYNWGVGI